SSVSSATLSSVSSATVSSGAAVANFFFSSLVTVSTRSGFTDADDKTETDTGGKHRKADDTASDAGSEKSADSGND
ncbi:hypothetical protein C6A85_13635, partial [Mycobacterium sp. ITM-2017-0098]